MIITSNLVIRIRRDEGNEKRKSQIMNLIFVIGQEIENRNEKKKSFAVEIWIQIEKHDTVDHVQCVVRASDHEDTELVFNKAIKKKRIYSSLYRRSCPYVSLGFWGGDGDGNYLDAPSSLSTPNDRTRRLRWLWGYLRTCSFGGNGTKSGHAKLFQRGTPMRNSLKTIIV